MLTMVLLGAAASGSGWIQLGAAVAAGAGAWMVIARRRARGPKPHSIALTPQHAVHIVDLQHARLVVGTGPGAAPRLLCELPGASTEPSSDRVVPLLRPSEALSAYGTAPWAG